MFQSRPSREGFCKPGRLYGPVVEPVSIPSKPGRVLQARSTRAGGATLRVSIPSKPGRVLQEKCSRGSRLASCFNPVQAGKGSARAGRTHEHEGADVSIPSKPGRVLQAPCSSSSRWASKFQSRPSREGFCKVPLLPYSSPVWGFQSRPSREGFCKRRTTSVADQPGRQVSIPSKPGRVLQVILRHRDTLTEVSIPSKPGRVLQENPEVAEVAKMLFQSRPSREGFCKRSPIRVTPVPSSFNPVQAGKGSASVQRDSLTRPSFRFQSRPSREGFCKATAARGTRMRTASFNPVQAGKGSARASCSSSLRPAPVSIPSKPGRVLQDVPVEHDRRPRVSIPSKPGRVLQGHPRGRPPSRTLFQSRPSREGFCKSGPVAGRVTLGGFNPVQAGKGSARTRREDRGSHHGGFNPVQAGKGSASMMPYTASLLMRSFNPVQAGKGSASVTEVAVPVKAQLFQSRPSREGFCKRDPAPGRGHRHVSIPSKPGRVLQVTPDRTVGLRAEAGFNPVQAGTGSASLRLDVHGRRPRHVSIPSKPGRVLQGFHRRRWRRR